MIKGTIQNNTEFHGGRGQGTLANSILGKQNIRREGDFPFTWKNLPVNHEREDNSRQCKMPSLGCGQVNIGNEFMFRSWLICLCDNRVTWEDLSLHFCEDTWLLFCRHPPNLNRL